MQFELEPPPPEPTRPDVVAVRERLRLARDAVRRARLDALARRRRTFLRLPTLARSTVLSIAAHAALIALVWLLASLRPHEERERPLTLTISLTPFVEASDPEARAGGPSPRAEMPSPAEAAAAPDVAPGRLFDDEDDSPTLGAGASLAGAAFTGRLGGKDRLLEQGGGDGATEGAVRLALEWLARHQDEDGSWGARSFARRCAKAPRCEGVADQDHREGATALALLPFLGAGHTHREGPWKDVVRRGLEALAAQQHADGSFGSGSKKGYATALGTLALAEAYGLTQSPSLQEPAARAVALLVRTQSRGGGWRYAPGDDQSDSSVTGWCVVALHAARKAGLDVPERTLRGCRAWFTSVRDPATGECGYLSRGSGGAALIGVGAFAEVALGADPASPALAPTFDLLERRLPRLPRSEGDGGTEYGAADPMHWYYGALAAFQRGGGTWTAWNARLRTTLLPSQVRDTTDARGSWPPVGATGRQGGRLVTTALCALALEVYYRYPRTMGR